MKLCVHDDFQSLTKDMKSAIIDNFNNFHAHEFVPMIPIVYYGEELTHYVMDGSNVIYIGSISAVRRFYENRL